jgi:arylsulfatase A-like enzyme
MPLDQYKPGTAFTGTIGLTVDESKPAWPEPRRARKGAPNVLFIVLDDTGYGQLGCYGGLIETPNFDRLAGSGLLYTNMHTTALCSPTRSCVMTGRNHHSNAMAGITEVSTGYPGYNGSIPFENGFLSEILLGAGYNTYAVGKWHLTPAEQTSAAGPYDRWPTGRGFERYYGFLGGDTHQYYPDLVSDNHQVEPPATPEEGYHLTEDLVDQTIRFIGDAKQVAPDKPFFTYLCTGAMHAPHQVPREWINRYAGQFDDGWEQARERIFSRQKELGIVPHDCQLPPHDPDVPAWDSLSDDERRVAARMMEVFAGFLTHTDHHIGRLLEFLEHHGELDNTLIMVISDNGASAEGGPHGSVNENRFFNFVPESPQDNLAALDELGGPKYFNHYPWGWTWAGNTPFRRWKRETFRGGVSDPFLVHWPAGIKARGELRRQYLHAIDMVPTVLEALQVEPPAEIRGVTQSPIQGVSFAHTFDDAEAPSRRRTQYFEMIGHRSIYHDGWRAVCPWPGDSFAEGRPFGTPLTADDLRNLDAHGWQLYHVAADPTESEDVAAQHPERLRELVALWYVEAGKYDVLPIDGRGQQRFAEERPQITADRKQYTYLPGTQAVPENAAANLMNRSFAIRARVEVPDGGAEGVLLCHGGNTGGYAFFVAGGRLGYVYNYVGAQEFRIDADRELPPGPHELTVEFERTGDPDIANGRGAPGHIKLFIDGDLTGEGDVPVTMPLMIGLGGGLLCGRAPANPITDAYRPPFTFTGTLHTVTVEVGREALTRHPEAEMRAAMAHQ